MVVLCQLSALLCFWSRLPTFVKVDTSGSVGHSSNSANAAQTLAEFASTTNLYLLDHHLSSIRTVVILMNPTKATGLCKGRYQGQHWSFGSILLNLPKS